MRQIETDGVAHVRNCLDAELVEILRSRLSSSIAGQRNLFDISEVLELARSAAIREIVAPVLGNACFAVRAILFNKVPEANWKVTWHQDCVIAVAERKEVPGFGPWSVKEGLCHVRPTSEIMSRMLAVRIHLDDCGKENGALRVLPGSHLRGILRHDEIVGIDKSDEKLCLAHAGDALLMRPLLLHASSPSKTPKQRRVIHLEFAAEALPSDLRWHQRIF